MRYCNAFALEGGWRALAVGLWGLLGSALLALGAAPAAHAQLLDENCTVNILNRTAQVNPDGTFALPNVPQEVGLFRVRVVCEDEDGNTVLGQSGFINLSAPPPLDASDLRLGPVDPIPSSLEVFAPQTVLTVQDEQVQLQAIGILPDGSRSNLSARARGTIWSTSNPAVATVTEDGLVTAVARGRVIISARHEGVLGSVALELPIPNDADGDGLPDEYELANGLDPNDPADAGQDGDGDGLNALEEFQLGTNPGIADSDGDGLADGDEVAGGTGALAPDSDGDGLLDGEESLLGTDALAADSDNDGIRDGAEVDFGSDPLIPNPTTTVHGDVVDPQGAAVAGAAVSVLGAFEGNTDNGGEFFIANVPADQGALAAFVQSIQAGQVFDGESGAAAAVPGGVTEVGTVTLAQVVGRVFGVVTRPDGTPAAGARVVVAPGDVGGQRATLGADQRTVNANDSGFFQVDNMAPGGMVAEATDLTTGLRAQGSGVLPDQGQVEINLALTPSGNISGRVFGQDGNPVGAGVDVSLRGPVNRQTTTGAAGSYQFDFVPLGAYRVEASDGAGNRGRRDTTLTGTNQSVVADVTYLGTGSITGIVESATGVPVPNAEVSFSSNSVFGGRDASTTDAQGGYGFDGVFLGNFSVAASDPLSGLGGFTSGAINFNGEEASVTVTLQPAGTLTGTVFESDGTTPAPGVEVVLSPSGRRAVTDASGVFEFQFLPLGNYTLNATNTANGDRQRAVATLNTAGATVSQDMILNGLGTVTVVVKEFDGVAAPQAQVRIDSLAGFGGTLQGVADAEGRVTFQNVLAGNFSVTAMDTVNQLGGSLQSNVNAGEAVEVELILEPAGILSGTVFRADGVTPAANVDVRLSVFNLRVTTAADGAFRFDMLPLARGPYGLEARDADGALRAAVGGIALDSHGVEVIQDLVLSGAGTVDGTVLNPDGSPAAGLGVTLDSDVPGARDRSTVTDSAGGYSFGAVPEGGFRVSARNGALNSAGVASGAVTADGETVSVDIQLVENQLPPPGTAPDGTTTLTRLFDANNFPFQVQQDGGVRDGQGAVWRGDNGANRGGMVLRLGSDVIDDFSGSGGSLEEDGREVRIPGTDPSGLNVVRKVFVPRDGYFARYLEILENPTGQSITVDLQLQNHFRFFQNVRDGFNFNDPPRVIATADGDTTVEPGDPWAVIDGPFDNDPFRAAGLPAVAHVVGGQGDAAALDSFFDVLFDAGFGRLQTEWNEVTVPAGGTVAVMHFAVQQTSRASAQSSAERLAQVPPEALAGMSAEECAAVVNFAVPADCSSTVDPLPPLIGTVMGNTLEGNGGEPSANASLEFQSESPYYRRVHRFASDETGRFRLDPRFNDFGSSRAIPVGPFTLRGSHRILGTEVELTGQALEFQLDPATGEPVVTEFQDFDGDGEFDAGGELIPASPPADADLAFLEVVFPTGAISGTVRRTDGTVVSSGTVRVSGGPLLNPVSTAIALDGSYRFAGLEPGTYTLTATLPIIGGTDLTGTASATAVLGADATVDITIVGTGGVQGVVTNGAGGPAVNVQVRLEAAGFQRTVRTDTGGAFGFGDVPEGDYDLRAIEPATGLASTATVAVLQDQVTTRDLQLIAVGRVQVDADFTSGEPVGNAAVQIRRDAFGSSFQQIGFTAIDGMLVINNVPAGDFDIRVINPFNGVLSGTTGGTITNAGETVSVAVTVPVDQPPAVTLTAPAAGSSFVEGSVVGLEADASDDLGVVRVEFLVDGSLVATDFSAPYGAGVPLPAFPADTSVGLQARAVDTGGQATVSPPVTVTVLGDGTPPTVSITAPSAGSTFIEGTAVFVTASASDDVAVDRVEFRANGTLFFSDSTPPFGGTFVVPADFAAAGPTPLTLAATAVDRAGNGATASTEVSVVSDDPPSVTLISGPASGSTLIEGTVAGFTAAANDDVGVGRVELLVNDGTGSGAVVSQTDFNAPYTFSLTLPPAADVVNPVRVTLRAVDTRGQTASTAPVEIQVAADEPPTVTITSPAAGASFVEGSSVTVTATAADDVGVQSVAFLVDGVGIAVDESTPYTAEVRIPGGTAGDDVTITARAVDAAGQAAEDSVAVVRLDDTEDPSAAITSPADGAIVSVGDSDVVIVIDTSGSTGSSCGADVTGDGVDDNILVCEVLAAKELVNFLDFNVARVAVVDFSSSAFVVQGLTQDRTQVIQALDTILAAGPGGGTNFVGAMSQANGQLVGLGARQGATPVQLFLSDGSASFPTSEVAAAADGAIVVNTFAVGSGASTSVLQQMADETGGVLTTVTDPSALVNLLPNIIRFGVQGLPVIVDASDDVAVEEVAINVTSTDVPPTVDQTVVDGIEPFATAVGLPTLESSLQVDVVATATDFGGNSTDSAPVRVTVLPAENGPQIRRIEPPSGGDGDAITLVGRFFDPVSADNLVTFRGPGDTRLPATILGGNKVSLQVTVPAGFVSGDVTVEAGGRVSGGASFIRDADLDGLADEEEAVLGTDPGNPDSDGDGLGDGEEVNDFGTDPLAADSDGDGLTDPDELNAGLDPNDGADAAADADGDGLTNAQEVGLGTDLFDGDTDNDGLSDAAEVNVHGTDPLVSDTDGGGRSDGSEVNQDGTDPLDPADDLDLRDSDDLFLLEAQSDNILRITPAGEVSVEVSRADILAVSGFFDVNFFNSGLAIDRQGVLYFTEHSSRGLYRVTPDRTVSLVASSGDFAAVTGNSFPFLEGLTVGADGGLYAVDGSTNQVLRIDRATGAVSLFASNADLQRAATSDSINLTSGIVGAPDGTIHVVNDAFPRSVLALAPNGSITAFDIDADVFDPDNYATLDSAGNLVMADDSLDRMARLSPAGVVDVFLDEAVLEAPTGIDVDLEGGIAFDSADNFFVAEENEDHILGFAAGTTTGSIFVNRDTIQAVTGTRPNMQGALEAVPLLDIDGDGLLDVDEAVQGTDANNPDSDGDGLRDGLEVALGLDPLAPDSDGNGVVDGAEDGDGDGLNNLDEQSLGTDAGATDTDGDGLEDAVEVNTSGTDPLRPDSDGDGLTDGDEVNVHGTDPLLLDTDGGGRSDGQEVLNDGTDPLDSDDDVRIVAITGGTNPADQAATVADAAGNIHVVWSDQREGNWAIFYKMLTGDGATLIDDTRLSDGSADARRPALALDSQGRIHVVWQDRRLCSTEVFHRVIEPGLDDQSGDAADPVVITVSGERNLSGDDCNRSPAPRIDVDPFDRAHVVWEDTDFSSVRYTQLEPDGTTRLAPRTIATGQWFFRLVPAVAVDADGHAHIVWSDQMNTCEPEIGYAMVDGDDGTNRIAASVISPDDCYASRRADVAVGPDGSVGIVFQDKRLEGIGPGTGRTEIFGTRIDPDLHPQNGTGTDISVVSVLPGPDNDRLLSPDNGLPSVQPALALDALGNGRVTYYDDWAGNGPGILLLKVVDPDGNDLVPEREVSDGRTADTLQAWTLPFVTVDGPSSIVTWTVEEGGTGNGQILLRVLDPDADRDGVADEVEAAAGTDPNNPDSDGDGLMDGYELFVGTDPLDADQNGNGVMDGQDDLDGDGLTGLEEQAAGTSALLVDTDGDGLDDLAEVDFHGTNPLVADSDGDGLGDGDEVDTHGTDPLNADSDGDGLTDGFEVDAGLDPNSSDSDGDGTSDGLEDNDGDGLSNAVEQDLELDPNSSVTAGDDVPDALRDGDGDGLINIDEISVHGTDPARADTDGGGRSDGDEVLEDGTDPLEGSDDFEIINLEFNLTDGAGFLWDIQGDGNISNGTFDAYDGGLRLSVNSNSFFFQGQGLLTNFGREVVIEAPGMTSGLDVTRRIFVPADAAFARFVEVLDNPSPSPVAATVELFTNLGSDSGTVLVATSDGDGAFTTADDWLITDDDDGINDPTMTHVFSGPGAAVEPTAVVTGAPGDDDISYTYDVTVPGEGRVAIMHFASQNPDRAAALASATALVGLAPPALEGLAPELAEVVVNMAVAMDSDGDGLTDDDEAIQGTDPGLPDSDGDGLMDGFEVDHGLNPLSADEDGNGTTDGADDFDGDGLDNAAEQAAGTDPNVMDSDGDGLSDGDEVNVHGTDPLRSDSDGDALDDAAEVNTHGTDPLNPDSDFGGAGDGDEVLNCSTDPTDPTDDASCLGTT